MEKKWTDAQCRAITAEGGSILVSAAAGSGKTSVLTERVVRKIEAGTDINRMLIVTFSNAAAAEMKGRIKQRLSALISEHPESGHLRRQNILLPSADICTVHSFCLNLIREHSASSGVSFDVSLGDENELKMFKRAAAENVVLGASEREDPDILDMLNPEKNDETLIENIIGVYEKISANAFTDDWMTRAEGLLSSETELTKSVFYGVLKEEALVMLRHYKRALSDVMSEIEEGSKLQTAYSPALTCDCEKLTSLIGLLQSDRYDEFTDLLATGYEKFGALKNFESELKERIKVLRDDMKKSLKKLSEDIFSFTAEEYTEDVKKLIPAVSAFFGMLREYEKEYKRLKAEKNIIDFSDVEHLAIELLTEKEGEKRVKSVLAKDLSEDYEEIMVDEFQDTNECQNAIFKAISRNEENLFMVGDIKQSIYRFRLADPGIFLRKLNSHSPIDNGVFPAKIILRDNFRSASSVCSFINCIFERIMTEYTGEISYSEEQRLQAFSEDECTPEVAVIEKEDEESEAVYVAERIKELLKSGYEVNGEKKIPDYGDIAVLMRTRRSFSVFSKVFTRYSIPYSVQSGENLFDTRECSTLLSFLRIIDNPMLDIDFAAVMLSPVFGFTPDDLIKLKLKRKKKLYECAKESENIRIVGFLELLRSYKSLSLSMSTSELIKKIIYETEFVNIFSALESGEERRGNLMRFLNAAKQFEKSGAVMLSSFIRYCEKCISNGGGFGGGNLVTGGRSVRLMTVHASKGLEFPVCFVSDTGRKFRRDTGRNPIIMHNRLGLCLKIRDLNRYICYTTAPYEAAKALENREFIAEEMRILYVALTRAKEKLIISAAVANREKYLNKKSKEKLQDEFELMRADSYIDWILPTISQNNDAVLSVWEKNEGAAGDITVPAEPSIEIMNTLIRMSTFRYKNAGIEKIPVRLSVSDIAKKASEVCSFNVSPRFSLEKSATAADRGTAMHKFMQYADYEGAKKSVSCEIHRLLENEFMSEAECELCDKQSIERFFASSLYERITNADDVKREYAFMYALSADRVMETEEKFRDEKILVQGIADCIIIEGDTFSVIDYKSDRVKSGDELKDRYFIQLEIYGEALEEKLGKKKKDLIIYSFSLGKEIKFS